MEAIPGIGKPDAFLPEDRIGATRPVIGDG
jgi:hypothetical protein